MMMPSPILITICLVLWFSATIVTSNTSNVLSRSSSLSVNDHGDNSKNLISQHGTFTCGFYGTGANAFWFAIWFTESEDRTVVWTANRDRPVNGKDSEVKLLSGGMVLTDADGSIVWQTNPVLTDADHVELQDDGNLVVRNPAGSVLWESFEFPTDTLLPNQNFTRTNRLVSPAAKGQFASGYFNMLYGYDNVLRLLYDGPEFASSYWPNPDYTIYEEGRTNYDSERLAKLNTSGWFESSDVFSFAASDYGQTVKRRLTLDHDGNLRLYSLSELTKKWVISWQAIIELCKIHGRCGKNGICVFESDSGPKCSCPPGYEMSDQADWNKGCRRLFNLTCPAKSNSQMTKFLRMPDTDYFGFDLNATFENSLDACKKTCLDDCSCEGFQYRAVPTRQAGCFTKYVLFNGFKSPQIGANFYLKVPQNFEEEEKVSDIVCGSTKEMVLVGSAAVYQKPNRNPAWNYLYGLAWGIGGIEVLFATITGWWIFVVRRRVPVDTESGYHIVTGMFRRFRYAELKKATNNFKNELGRGGSGTVYKGVLEDKRVVAVKRLEDVSHGEEVFWAEVSTIGKINHMNLVRVWGFCFEKSHKLLVYEYVENLSLDRHLFLTASLEWTHRFKVALGTAKGLAYLHHECLEWVIHCDVKPENILLDRDFEAKIADFGLAKLLQRDVTNSDFSEVRGTQGYMAPEWALSQPITSKVDIYSYGVVMLELVTGARLSSSEAEMEKFVAETKVKLQRNKEWPWIEEIVDPALGGKYSKMQVLCMLRLGVACVNEDWSKRPTMDEVVQGLVQFEDE